MKMIPLRQAYMTMGYLLVGRPMMKHIGVDLKREIYNPVFFALFEIPSRSLVGNESD
jgi:hypothetical protein